MCTQRESSAAWPPPAVRKATSSRPNIRFETGPEQSSPERQNRYHDAGYSGSRAGGDPAKPDLTVRRVAESSKFMHAPLEMLHLSAVATLTHHESASDSWSDTHGDMVAAPRARS